MSLFAARLAALQLPLVYLLAMLFGLAIYGSEFDTAQGWVYQLSLPAVLVIGLLPARFAGWAERAARPVALVGIGLAAWAYEPLHFAWWDERSLDQSLRLAALGLAAAVVALGARAKLERAQVGAARGLAPALVVIALVWLGALWQPMLPFLGLAPGFAIVFAAGTELSPSTETTAPDAPLAVGWSRYVALLAGLDLSLVAWDWQTNSAWASPFASGLATAALAAWVVARIGPRALPFLVAVWMASFAFAAVDPSYSATHAHAEFAGALLGGLFAASGARAASMPYWALLGFLPAHLVTQHLAFASLRVLLLIPFLIAFLRSRSQRTPRTT